MDAPTGFSILRDREDADEEHFRRERALGREAEGYVASLDEPQFSADVLSTLYEGGSLDRLLWGLRFARTDADLLLIVKRIRLVIDGQVEDQAERVARRIVP